MTNQLTNYPKFEMPSRGSQSGNPAPDREIRLKIKALSTVLVDFSIDPLDSLLCTTGHITKLLIGNNLFVNSSQDCRI